MIDSRERVERGGRVERDRNASEEAPIGYRTMNRLYLCVSFRGWTGQLVLGKEWGSSRTEIENSYLAQVRAGISTPRRAHS